MVHQLFVYLHVVGLGFELSLVAHQNQSVDVSEFFGGFHEDLLLLFSLHVGVQDFVIDLFLENSFELFKSGLVFLDEIFQQPFYFRLVVWNKIIHRQLSIGSR